MRVYRFIQEDVEHQSEVFSYLDLIKPKNSFRMFKMFSLGYVSDLSYEDVDYVKRLFLESTISSMLEAISIAFKINKKLILLLRLKTFMSLIKFVSDELIRLNNEESKLEVFTDEKIKMALEMSKSDVMNQFGIYNSIDTLAKGDVTKWDEIAKMPYSIVQFKLSKNIVSDSLQKAFQENYNKLNKIK